MANNSTEKLLKLSQVSIIKQDSDDSYLGKTATAAAASKLANESAIGSATKPVYFTAEGVPEVGTYELNKTVPADAVFTDTTYADVTADSTGAADSGLMTSSDKDRLDKIADGAQVNVLEGIVIDGTDETITGKKVTLGTAAKSATAATVANDATLPTGAAVQSYVTGLGYQTSSDVESAINAKIATAMDWKGTKATKAELPSSDNKSGDVYHVTADGSEYAWNGSEWEELGVTFDATGYVQSSDIVYATDDEVRTALGQTVQG